jgi:hypothetical protein
MIETCEWTLDDDENCFWRTQCGNLFAFEGGTPSENSFKFCCYCGGALKEAMHVQHGDKA